jgi:hypothetical protein
MVEGHLSQRDMKADKEFRLCEDKSKGDREMTVAQTRIMGSEFWELLTKKDRNEQRKLKQ